MTLWNKITIGCRFLFGGWESALDYLLGFLNDYLAKPSVAEKVKEVHDTARWALNWMLKISAYIPEKWRDEYAIIMNLIGDIVAVAADGKVEAKELSDLIETFRKAKEKWDED